MNTPKERIRRLNSLPVNDNGKYILYWMQAYRRFDSNHAFSYALHLAKSQKKELIVYEGLRKDYPWNSKRIHKFILEGMIENRSEALRLGINYWSFVEDKNQSAIGILKKIANKASTVITDDFPCFIIPEQSEKLAKKIECAMLAVDGNSVIPFSQFEKFASAARILRVWIHKKFPEYFFKFAKHKHSSNDFLDTNLGTKPPFKSFEITKENLDSYLNEFTFEADVLPYDSTIGGRKIALKLLKDFIKEKLPSYLEERSKPNDQKITSVSSLSPYLHFGYISSEEIVKSVLDSVYPDGIDIEALSHNKPGERDTFFSKSLSVNHFLDELITWRDIGYLFFFKHPGFRIGIENLPDWVKKNLSQHVNDKREYIYARADWEAAKTHDPLWNAAQNELKITGRMHNYMRMLWGKKIIEWSVSFEDAFNTMEYLNNKYAYDGRNPNSYTGILWCFGLFDRPWFPERNVFGNIRYMSSDSTKKKFKMNAYLEYVSKLQGNTESLF
ncbi:MAG: deoxyribodipyrimidine photolyase [Leptospira sp.]|nr:deoxyribodipyrimidine photolyase [Leptospira sp.]